MTKHTPLYDDHRAMGARMTDFAGWDMPLHYGSQIEEHHLVRSDAGIFDISHMTVLDIDGERAGDFLRHLLANDVAKLKEHGKALYSCMLNERGGVIDDLIVYFMGDNRFRMVVNAATRDKDLAWIERQGTPFSVKVRERSDLAMVAAQGPNARDKVHRALIDALGDGVSQARGLKRFFALECDGLFMARTGYTGEDGYEIVVPAHRVSSLWQALADAGIAPAGLGARDTLRLEAGMNLYGQDMTEDITPLESGLHWTVAFEPVERDFIGRKALEAQRGQERYKRIGLILEAKGVPRPHQRVLPMATNPSDNPQDTDPKRQSSAVDSRDEVPEDGIGEITSGGFSPTLGKAIALARVPVTMEGRCAVEIRGRQLAARIIQPPFV
uniref:Aminomethyltransferase n=1 Tax=Candidatus Kentrum sp. LFY TaxID=2126342 RepID=A0A450UC85_9GAMM|nr:MAG: aminomethyltransferase [Candidatus Kentron sp. LFY]